MELIREQAKAIRRASLKAAEEHYASETPWYNAKHWLGIPLALLSAVAGATAFSQLNHSATIAGALSLTVAILTTLSTVLSPEKKASEHHKFAKEYEKLYNQAGLFYKLESVIGTPDQKALEEKLNTLITTLEDLNVNRPGITRRAYRIAEANLEIGKGEVIKVSED
jgi:hypothetical protein